jgi:hypothetical protein
MNFPVNMFTVGDRGDGWQVGQVGEIWELRLGSLGVSPATLAVLSSEPIAHDYDFEQ